MRPLRGWWLVSLLGLSACAATTADTPPPVQREALPVTDVRWVSVIALPNLYGHPAIYRGEFRTSGQCLQSFRAAVQLMASHKGNGTVSPCVLGVATTAVPE